MQSSYSRCEAVAANKTRRPLVQQMHDSKIKFPLPCRYDHHDDSDDDHYDKSDDDSNDDSVQGPEAGRPADQGQQTRDILPVITVLCCYPHLGPLYTQREI